MPESEEIAETCDDGGMRPWCERLLGFAARPWGAAALAVLLGLPSLGVGFQLDDYIHRALVLHRDQVPALPDSPLELFTLSRGRPNLIPAFVREGVAPWWTPESMRLAFWRPLAALSHIADYRLFPHDPVPMHAINILLIGAVAGVASALYRRVIGPSRVAALAALLYAVDHGHVMSASWISSRNTLLAALFALASVAAHVRWRQGEGRAITGPALFALALASGESGLATLAYVAAWALCCEEGEVLTRARTLAGHAAVFAVWAVAYVAQDYGTSGSEMYVDPLREPAAYLAAAATRIPILLLGQWALPPSQIAPFYSAGLLRAVAAGGALFLAIVAWTARPLLLRSPTARFLAVGMGLAVLPIAATLPNERLLLLVGFGAMGLLALMAQDRLEAPASGALDGRTAARAARRLVLVLLVLRLPISALMALGSPGGFRMVDRLTTQGYEDVLRAEAGTGRRALLLNAPGALFSAYLGSIALEQGRGRVLWYHLASGTSPIRLERPDGRTLVLAPEAGFAPSPGTIASHPPLDPATLLQHLDSLYRGPTRPMSSGERVTLNGLEVEVLRVDAEGRPMEAAFRFDRRLEDPGLAWYAWRNGKLRRYTLPPPGGRATLEPVPVRLP